GVPGGEGRRAAQWPRGRVLAQLMGALGEAPLRAGAARRPGAAAEPIELDGRLLRAVAGEQVDVLDRQEQLVAAGIVDLEAIMRRTGRLDLPQPHEPAEAAIDMHHPISVVVDN